MRLRTIIMLLSILAFLSIAIGGFYYYYSLRESAYSVAQRRAAWQTEMIESQVSLFLLENLKPVKALAGLREIRAAAEQPDQSRLDQANALLDHFQYSLEVDVCYLMNPEGYTIASSNRHEPDSFVGQNFGFRPYFQNAMSGLHDVYLALGTTSKKRGAYLSYPVWGESDTQPKGVIVIKVAVQIMERNIIGASEGITLLVGPHGIIFSTNREDWLYKTLAPLTGDEKAEIADSRQFGAGPWNWVGLEMQGDNMAVDGMGYDYLFYSTDLEHCPGWRVIHLLSLEDISQSIFQPLVRTTSLLVFALYLFAGLAVYYLSAKARHEIRGRLTAEADLRRSEARYRSLYHKTPAMLHSIDPEGRLVSVCDYWIQAMGYRPEEVIGRRLTDFMTETSRARAERKVLPDFLKHGACKDASLQFVRHDGLIMDVLWSAVAEREPGGDVVRSLAVFLDITERIRAEEKLKAAQEKLSHYSKDLERQVRERTREITGFLEYTPAVVYMKDTEGRYILVNSRHEELSGLHRDDVVGKTVFDVFPYDIAEQFRQNDLRVLTEKRPNQSEERFPEKDGEEQFYLSVRFPILDENGRVRRLCGSSVNITALKRAQNKLRRLSGNIISNQEKERTAIARELHDELGQVLTALRMDAVWLKEKLLHAHPQASERASNMCDLIESTISEVSRISRRLRPAVLDDLGLIEALEWHTTDFEKRTGIVCVFRYGNIPRVNETVAIAIYRIAQEALTNAARHSSATNVDVDLEIVDGRLTLSVTDNGCGFDTDRNEGFGIVGMRERAYLIGGNLEIRSRDDLGTEVTLTLSVQWI